MSAISLITIIVTYFMPFSSFLFFIVNLASLLRLIVLIIGNHCSLSLLLCKWLPRPDPWHWPVLFDSSFTLWLKFVFESLLILAAHVVFVNLSLPFFSPRFLMSRIHTLRSPLSNTLKLPLVVPNPWVVILVQVLAQHPGEAGLVLIAPTRD